MIRPTVSSTSSKYRPGPPLESLRVGDTTVVQTPSIGNLGVKFGQYFNFKDHAGAICKTVRHQLRDIAKIRKYFIKSSEVDTGYSFFCEGINK